MGATNIDFVIKGKASKAEIESRFKRQVDIDASENGSQSGYSGDFQTVDRVDFKNLGEIFNDFDSAYDFCLDKAQKWTTVGAVYYKNKKGEIDTLVAGWGAC